MNLSSLQELMQQNYRGKPWNISRRMAQYAFKVRSLCAILFLLAVFPFRAAGAEGETELLKAATDAFKDKFYKRAEEQFADFAKKFPGSTNLAEAILYQAQSRHFQKEHDGAIELLRTNLPKAGPLADQYVFTWGDALAAKGEHRAAADQYGKLLTDYPNSRLGLQTAYLQAYSHFQAKDFARVIDLLQKSDGHFQKLASTNAQDRFSFSGGLLLAEALQAGGQIDEARKIAAAANAPVNRPDWQWEKLDLLSRIELAGPTPLAVLGFVTNAVAAAEAAQRPRFEAQSWNVAAEMHRKLGQTNLAVSAYEKIAGIESLPVDQRRLALLKAVELLSTGGSITNAIFRLERYLGTTTNEPAADLLRVKAGELWLEQFRVLARNGTNTAAATAGITNAIAEARGHLNIVIRQYTNSAHLGRAWLNLGWTFWEEGILFKRPARLQESVSAFNTAAERLVRSDDQALARFKLADAYLYLKNPAAAVTNYLAVLRDYNDLPQVKNALFDKTYAQLVRAKIELGDLAGAKAHLAELRSAFPNGPLTDESLHLVGQALSDRGEAKEARAVFQDLITNYPSSPRIPEVRFAEAGTYAMEGENAAAIQKHEQWLATYTNHVLRPEVEFQSGVLLDKTGKATNALGLFSKFVATYPRNPLSPAAQTWIADYYYNQQLWQMAEQHYQRVFQNTNWTGGRLVYEALLMAAKTAFRRQGYNDARSYLTTLVNDPKCPADIQPEAWFALGDVFLEEPITGTTNAVQNFTQAAAVFDRIANQFSSNIISVQALGKKGSCYYQLGALTKDLSSYTIASNAFNTVLNSKAPDLPVKTRNQAEFGLALVLERIAEMKTGAERENLLQVALNRLLNIVYSENSDGPDPYYLKLAGREAGRLAESLGDTDAAIQLYKRLSHTAPALRSMWESRIALLETTREQKGSTSN
jgi:TolA-binding protein